MTLPPLRTLPLFHMKNNAGLLSAITMFYMFLALESTFLSGSPGGSQLTQQPSFALGLQHLALCLLGCLRVSQRSGSGSPGRT